MPLKIVCIGDTHCQLDKVIIPDGDILVHSGDLTYRGTIEEISKELFELSKHRARFKSIVFVAGNHDWLFERNPKMAEQMCKDNGITLLQDSSIIIEGVRFYGSPYQPEFCNWAFNLPRGKALKNKWDLIPEDTQVLVSHGPPKGILDVVPRPKGFHAGCDDLYNRVLELKELKAHIFGHLHMNHGKIKIGNTEFVNAATCTEEYNPTYEPITIEI